MDGKLFKNVTNACAVQTVPLLQYRLLTRIRKNLIDAMRNRVKQMLIDVVAVEGDVGRHMIGMNTSLTNSAALDQRVCVDLS